MVRDEGLEVRGQEEILRPLSGEEEVREGWKTELGIRFYIIPDILS